MRQREHAALARLAMRRAHLRHVLHEKKLGEVIVDAGAREMLARAQRLPRRQRLAPKALMHSRALRPGGAPAVPGGQRTGDLLMVGGNDAVGKAAMRPMRNRR